MQSVLVPTAVASGGSFVLGAYAQSSSVYAFLPTTIKVASVHNQMTSGRNVR